MTLVSLNHMTKQRQSKLRYHSEKTWGTNHHKLKKKKNKVQQLLVFWLSENMYINLVF